MALEGETTRLRAVERADAERGFRWVNDRDVSEHLALVYPMAMAAEDEWAEGATRRASYRNVAFAIEIAESGETIGNCGLHGGNPEDRSAELGVMIGEKHHWGKGYAFDALRTLVTFGFREMNLRSIRLRVDDNHARAVALYERLGFQSDGRQRAAHWSRGRSIDFLMMTITRDEFDELYGAYEEVGDVPSG